VVDLNWFKYFGGEAARFAQVGDIKAAVPAFLGKSRPVLLLKFVQEGTNEPVIVCWHCFEGTKQFLRSNWENQIVPKKKGQAMAVRYRLAPSEGK
jgi:hypothetical protein